MAGGGGGGGLGNLGHHKAAPGSTVLGLLSTSAGKEASIIRPFKGCVPRKFSCSRESSGPHREPKRVWSWGGQETVGVGSGQENERVTGLLTASTSGLHPLRPPLPPYGRFISLSTFTPLSPTSPTSPPCPSPTCLALSLTVWLNTVQMTPWAQGGVVRDPS